MKKQSLLTKSEEALIFYIFCVTMVAAVPKITDDQIRDLFQQWPEEGKLEIIQFAMNKFDEYRKLMGKKK